MYVCVCAYLWQTLHFTKFDSVSQPKKGQTWRNQIIIVEELHLLL